MSGLELGSIAASAATSAGAWAWKLLENPFIDFLKRRWEDAKDDSEKAQYLQTRWNEFDWGKATDRYKERLKANYGHIRVLGSTEPKSLDDLFTDVYILEKPRAFRRFDVTQLRELQKEPERLEQVERIPGLRVVVQKRGHRLYILGQPGAGKTTFLKYLIQQTMVEDWGKIPIFITIKDWADSEINVLDFIIQQFDICHFPNALPFIEYILEKGKAIVLFDGLDEVKQEDNLRSRIINDLHNFCKKYSETQAIVTCRVAASDYSFTEFTYVELSDFTDEQIENYVRKWFGKDINKADQFLEELKKTDNKGVRELGRSPLLLSLICLAYDETLHIPQRRVELYEEALDALLKKWDASRNIQRDLIQHVKQAEIYKKLLLGRKKQMFARIAAETFKKGEIFIPQKKLVQIIESYLKNLPPVDASENVDGEVILRAIEAQHGILVERAQGIYSFSHLTFQEYYTAKYITDNVRRNWTWLVEHLSDNRWREVFILVASLLDEAHGLFDAMRQTASGWIYSDSSLLKIQKWVMQKGESVVGFEPGAVRGIYWFLTLDPSKIRDLELNPVVALDQVQNLKTAHSLIDLHELTLIRTLEVASSLATALSRAPKNARDIDEALNIARTHALDIAYELDRERAHTRTRPRDFIRARADLFPRARQDVDNILLDTLLIFSSLFLEIFKAGGNLDEIQAYYYQLLSFFDAIQSISKLCEPSFALAVDKLPLPPVTAFKQIWIQYEKDWRILLIEYRNIGHDWKLNRQQCINVGKYLAATHLLVNCLEVAYVRDREAILAKILTVEP